MEIENSDDRRLRIILSLEEMTELFGSYEEIDYNDPYIRSALHLLINRALPDCRYLSDCERLLIEVKPFNDGCIIELTKHRSNNKTRRLYPEKNWRLDFFDTESMLEALCFLYNKRGSHKNESSLFHSQNGYHAIIKGTKVTVDAIKQYCTAVSASVSIAAVYEYAIPICENNAIGLIGAAFNKGIC